MSEWENERGTLRVRVVQDSDATMPESDASGHVYSLTPSLTYYSWEFEMFAEGLGSAPDLDCRWTPDDEADRAKIERWFRIFHEAVSIAWHRREMGGWLLEVVTREQAESWGLTAETWGSAANLEEWAAWDAGEVYGYVVEERVTWDRVTPVRGLYAESRRETWESLDSCWGFYGYTYAVEAAKEALADLSEVSA